MNWIVLAAFVLVFYIWLVIMLITAPKGREDENGFHYDEPKKRGRR